MHTSGITSRTPSSADGESVSAVLDYFQVERVTLIGGSLGGCLVMRVAALEPRIERVVAFDIFTNGLDIALRQTPASRFDFTGMPS